MKTLLVGVVFVAFLVLPLSARLQAAEGPSCSRAYPQKKHFEKHLTKPLGATGLDGSAWNFNQTASNADPMKEWPCRTAPEFCPD